MNGVHDMGGMTCFGPVEAEPDEPVFHAEWERRVFAMSVAMASVFGPIDARRYALEMLEPAFYLRSSYYERWFARLEAATAARRLVEPDAPVAADPPPGPEFFAEIARMGKPASRDGGRMEPRFAVGDRVRARNIQPEGHTRLPRYARGRAGVIERHHGTHVFPDANAHGLGEDPQPLYTVRFAARELWGEAAAARDTVCIDLWEDHLEPDGSAAP